MWCQILTLAASTAFAAWLIFFGGAERLEGSFGSAFVFHPLAPTASASILKLLALVAWLASLGYFMVAALP